MESDELGVAGPLHEDGDEGLESRRWDEGLTQEERVEAKRKYKNHKSTERWRRRKKEELARLRAESEGGKQFVLDEMQRMNSLASIEHSSSSLDQESPNGVENFERNMLFEHTRLGKVEESSLLSLLHQMSSYSLLPNGFVSNKEDIMMIADKAVSLIQHHAPADRRTARLLLGMNLRPKREWLSASYPALNEIYLAFTEGRVSSLRVNLSLSARPNKKISVKQLAAMPESVHTQLYLNIFTRINSLIPMAISNSGQAEAALNQITQLMLELTVLLTSLQVGQPSIYKMIRSVRNVIATPAFRLQSAVETMRISPGACRELWQGWRDLSARLPALLAAKQRQEREIETILMLMDQAVVPSQDQLLWKVRELLDTYESITYTVLGTELKWIYEVLTPLQVAIMGSAQLPPMSAKEVLVNNLDPLMRLSAIFDHGLLPHGD